VRKAVAIKQRRLSHLAYAMQESRQAEIPAGQAVEVLTRYLLERERVPDPLTAQTWAENFLASSHERSGLLVERDPEVYTSCTKVLEFLVAIALVNQSKPWGRLAHAGDDW
jgi:hypothetical protein